MANNYLEFSEALDVLTKEEIRWLQEQLEEVTVESAAMAPTDEDVGDWTGPRFLQDLSESGEYGYCGFEYQFEGPGFSTHSSGYGSVGEPTGEDGEYLLWLYSGESGDVEHVARLVQAFLRRFRPNCFWSLTYATLCSKPRIGEFGGGGVVVTADEVYWFNAYDAVHTHATTWLATHPDGKEANAR